MQDFMVKGVERRSPMPGEDGLLHPMPAGQADRRQAGAGQDLGPDRADNRARTTARNGRSGAIFPTHLKPWQLTTGFIDE
ncbi:hypothetical protein [Komagataeibacter swingsii]|uniref:Uncharacterized protein n=1 Tax=Komagataeibacter swingsii TaxID=215220 RepID=A0A2V4R5K7_9PROT|nr:hypothetical protein [Komagataeibacter swingsii]PYD71393.1 hypothetical protein CFR76_01610 [Komagataeibacter swingsii]